PVKVGLSAGFDLKNYKASNFRTNIFTTVSVIPPANPNDPPQVVSGETQSGNSRSTALTYLPVSVRGDVSVPDSWGATAFSLGASYNLPLDGLSDDSEFQKVAPSSDASANFFIFNGSITRDQKVAGDWRALFRLEGQVANEPVFSNEQFALGGLN